MITANTLCIYCIHLFPVKGAKCKAFYDGIPDVIYKGNLEHREPYYGDGGIQFELNPKMKKFYDKKPKR